MSLLALARARAPGVALAAVVAGAAWLLGARYGAPAMLLALLLGMALNFLTERAGVAAGVDFSARTVLRVGVALLGLRLTFGDVAALGPAPALAVAGLIAATIGVGMAVARLLGRDWRFGLLTGGATAICGASAAMAFAAVLPRGPDAERDTLFTVVGVTTLSTVAMILYPLLFAALGSSPQEAGFLLGATIHDVAQVVGAGYSMGPETGDVAVLVKLTRVALLPVALLAAIWALSARDGASTPGLPWFVVVFVALLALNSLGVIPQAVAAAGVQLSSILLLTAIAALGIKTSLRAMGALGGAGVALIVAETLFLLVAATLLALLARAV